MSKPIEGYRRAKKSQLTDVTPNCPVCGKAGQVATIRTTDVLNLVCDCGHKWKSLSSQCQCGELTGFAVEGFCEKCYREYQERKGVA